MVGNFEELFILEQVFRSSEDLALDRNPLGTEGNLALASGTYLGIRQLAHTGHYGGILHHIGFLKKSLERKRTSGFHGWNLTTEDQKHVGSIVDTLSGRNEPLIVNLFKVTFD